MSLLFSVLSAHGQVQVESKLDSIEIMIGEQVKLTLNVNCKKGQTLEMPRYEPSQYITPGVEVLSETTADTADLDNDMMQVTKFSVISPPL